MRRFLFVLMAVIAAISAVAEKPSIKFTWGADAGASIDLSGNDMSAVDFNAVFGMSRGWINFLGLGVEADIMISNSCRSYPIYVNFRTNFQNKPSLLFWDIKLGTSLNYLEHNHQQTGLYGATGLGINLARSSKFSTHLIIGYTYRERKTVVGEEMTHHFKSLNYATVKIGVLF